MRQEEQEKDNEIKLSKYYDSRDMKRYINYYEFFADLIHDERLNERQRRAAESCMNHYRRMCICMLTKDIPDDFKSMDVLDLRTALEIADISLQK